MNKTNNLHYQVLQSSYDPTETEWRVEAIDDENEGLCSVALFSGPLARERAEEYAAFKNAPGRVRRLGGVSRLESPHKQETCTSTSSTQVWGRAWLGALCQEDVTVGLTGPQEPA